MRSARIVLTAIACASTFALGCFGTEVPPDKPAESPLSGTTAPTSKPENASNREDKPGERKASTFDKQQTQVSVNRGARQAAECAKIHKEGPFGELSVTLVIANKGKIEDAQLPPPFADTAIGKCVEKAFEHEIIPPWDGPAERLSATVTLKKPTDAAPEPPPKKKLAIRHQLSAISQPSHRRRRGCRNDLHAGTAGSRRVCCLACRMGWLTASAAWLTADG